MSYQDRIKALSQSIESLLDKMVDKTLFTIEEILRYQEKKQALEQTQDILVHLLSSELNFDNIVECGDSFEKIKRQIEECEVAFNEVNIFITNERLVKSKQLTKTRKKYRELHDFIRLKLNHVLELQNSFQRYQDAIRDNCIGPYPHYRKIEAIAVCFNQIVDILQQLLANLFENEQCINILQLRELIDNGRNSFYAVEKQYLKIKDFITACKDEEHRYTEKELGLKQQHEEKKLELIQTHIGQYRQSLMKAYNLDEDFGESGAGGVSCHLSPVIGCVKRLMIVENTSITNYSGNSALNEMLRAEMGCLNNSVGDDVNSLVTNLERSLREKLKTHYKHLSAVNFEKLVICSLQDILKMCNDENTNTQYYFRLRKCATEERFPDSQFPYLDKFDHFSRAIMALQQTIEKNVNSLKSSSWFKRCLSKLFSATIFQSRFRQKVQSQLQKQAEVIDDVAKNFRTLSSTVRHSEHELQESSYGFEFKEIMLRREYVESLHQNIVRSDISCQNWQQKYHETPLEDEVEQNSDVEYSSLFLT